MTGSFGSAVNSLFNEHVHEGFRNSGNILDDPVLLEVFRQCGCAHLAEMRSCVGRSPQAYAAELRKYLRLDEEKRLQALSRRLGVSLPPGETLAARAA